MIKSAKISKKIIRRFSSTISLTTITYLYFSAVSIISPVHDKIREDFQKNHPQIFLNDITHNYNLSVFQRCINTKSALLIPECWKNIHPDIISLPVYWDYTVPYGILYSSNPSEPSYPGVLEKYPSGHNLSPCLLGLYRSIRYSL